MHYAWDKTCELNTMNLLFMYYECHVLNALHVYYIC